MTRKSFIPNPPKYPLPPRATSDADRCTGLLANGRRCFHQVCHSSSRVCRIHAMIMTLNNTRIVPVNPHPMDHVANTNV